MEEPDPRRLVRRSADSSLRRHVLDFPDVLPWLQRSAFPRRVLVEGPRDLDEAPEGARREGRQVGAPLHVGARRAREGRQVLPLLLRERHVSRRRLPHGDCRPRIRRHEVRRHRCRSRRQAGGPVPRPYRQAPHRPVLERRAADRPVCLQVQGREVHDLRRLGSLQPRQARARLQVASPA